MKTQIIIALLALSLAACTPHMSVPTDTPFPTATSTPLPPTPTLEATPVIARPTSLPTLLTIVPTLIPAQAKEQEELKSVIQAYFDLRYQALSVSPSKDFQQSGFGNLTSDEPDARDFLVTEMAKLAVERKWIELNRFGYAKYEYSLKYKNIVIDASAQIATVSLLEDFTVVTERAMELNPEKPSITRGDLTHEIVLHNVHGQWKIVSDIYRDAWWRSYRKPGMSTDEILHKINAELQKLEAMPSATPLPPTFTPTPEVPFAPATVMPTLTPIPIFTPDAIQVKRWQEYQTELAKLVVSTSGAEFPLYEDAFCEWDILGRSGQELYVWAVCGRSDSGGRKPAVIYLNADGSIRDVKVVFPGPSQDSKIRELFPTNLQEKIFLYYSSERSQEMGRQIMYRITHPEEPPFVILSAMPTATLTP